ncbi:MAG: Uma2 family endonuclease [bacterium]|nr:Uma2 family endonuclease [bacterium]
MDTSAPKMEARATTVHTPRVGPVRPLPAPPGAEDPFRLGFRECMTTTPDGREVLEQVPLTAEDLLYPQEGDHVAQGFPHFSFLHPQADAMRRYLEKRPGIVVSSDVMLVLRHDGKTCAPDVAVIAGHFDTSEIDSGINLRAVGGRLCFAFEAISTSAKEIEEKDLKKNQQRYAKEGVEEYFTVYPQPGRKVSNLVGRRLGPSRQYAEIVPDAQGRVVSKTLDLFFSIDAETQELVVVDATSGERLRISDEEEAARAEAERRLAEETAARQKAETDLEEESQARLQALAEVERLKAQLRQIRDGDDG